MKKKSGLEQNPDDQFDVLHFLEGLPPLSLMGKNLTDDQIETLRVLKTHYRLLSDALKAYFSGQKNPIEDPKIRASVEADMKFYLAIYNMAWFGWREIEAEARTQGLDEIWLESPGELLKAVLFWECIRAFEAISSKNFKPNDRETMALLQGKELLTSPKDGLAKKRLDRTLAYGRETLEDGGMAPKVMGFCEFAIKKRLRGKSQLKKELEDYRQAKKTYIKATKKFLQG
jgi:hypothetical protein